MWKPKWEKTTKFFSYISKQYIHWKHQLLDSPVTTRRRFQPPILKLQLEGTCNSLIIWLQPEGGYNPLSLPRPTTLKYNVDKFFTTYVVVTDNLLFLLFMIPLLLLLKSISHQDCNHLFLMPKSTREFSKLTTYELPRHTCS